MGISSSLGSSALLPAGLGFRNVLINGDFKVWQRGTSFTVTSGSPYTADRWCVTLGGTANFSVSRQTANLDGFQYCLRLQRTASNTNTSALYLSQPVETVNSIPLANKQITFSFYARAGANFSAASSALNVRIVTGTGTDGNYLVATLTGQAFQLDTTATLTTSWQRFTYSVLVPSGVNQIQPVFFYTPVGTAGAADNFDVAGVQLEQNYQATPFEQRPIGVELALCQRYYETSNGLVQVVGGSTGFGGNTYWSWVGYKVEKRIALNLVTNNTSNGVRVFATDSGSDYITMFKAATQYYSVAENFETWTTQGFGINTTSGQADAGLGRFSWNANAEL
jgi:hypothetical protein